MTDYLILENSSSWALMEQVKEYGKDGWVCQGSISAVASNGGFMTGGNDVLYLQAMVKP